MSTLEHEEPMVRSYRFLPALAGTVGLLLTMSACASGGYYRYPAQNPSSTRQIEDRAYRNGYEEGRQRGELDARRGLRVDYSRHNEYRSADSGYSGNGNRNAYRQTFRQGFVAGYNDSYRVDARRDPRYGPPNRPGYGGSARAPANGSFAAQSGYRDGFEQGQRDLRDRRPFDPVRAPRYRSGDHDYNGRYGSRDEYKREYRASFQQGYAQGYGR